MKPIIFSRSDVALIVRIALALHPGFRIKRHSVQQLRLIAAGRMRPTPAVLNRFHLQEREGSYSWDVQ